MAATDSRVNVSVSDRILAHLWEQDHQADHYLVTFEMTRPGIAEVCALHLPNVSRSMRELISDGLVSEHTRAVRGEERRQKTCIHYSQPCLRGRKMFLHLVEPTCILYQPSQ